MLDNTAVSRSLAAVDPCPLVAADMMGSSTEEVASLLDRHRQENPCIRPVARARRRSSGGVDLVDRLAAPGDSLPEHLSRQLYGSRCRPRLLALASWLIWNLEPDGYLREDLRELARVAAATEDELEEALAIVQSLEPTGVGARSLQECLALQLRTQRDPDPLAIQLVNDHLHALADRRYDEIARTLHVSPDRILRALGAIRRLEPRPGRPFGDAPAQTVRPEVTIEKVAGGYEVVVHSDDLPEIRVSQRCWATAAAEHGEARRPLALQLRAASWLVTAFAHRRETLRGVVESIVRRQRPFLDRGPAALRPLSIHDVAADVGVHDSTVSRAVAHRYAETPHGVLPLRWFFTNRLPGDPAGLASPVAARQRIRELVAGEDPDCPLTDNQIARALARQRIRIARRTVVKYRELLGIASAASRRSRTA